ncbi:hypothetical protein P4B35_17300 [Pontiellaceae bacterium B12227]|nr:hypothetical protein [Pontiellaceae bacterium B12227]
MEPNIAALKELSVQHDFQHRAEAGFYDWIRNEKAHFPDQIKPDNLVPVFRSTKLCFDHSLLPHPYYETKLIIVHQEEEVGYYKFIAMLDGTVDDDYFVLY